MKRAPRNRIVRFLSTSAMVVCLATPAMSQAVQTWQYGNMTTTATTTFKSAPGVLHCITFNKPVATGVITINDNTTTGGNVIGTITVPSSPMPVTVCYDVAFLTGLTIQVATAAQDLTVSFR